MIDIALKLLLLGQRSNFPEIHLHGNKNFHFSKISNIKYWRTTLLRYRFLHHPTIFVHQLKAPIPGIPEKCSLSPACAKKDWLVELCQQLEVIKVILYQNCRYQHGWRPNDGNEDACRKITLSMCWGPSVTKFSQQDCQGEKTCTWGHALAPCSLLFTKVKYTTFSIAKSKIKMRTDLCWEVEDLWLGHSHDHSLGQRLVQFILYISFKMLMPIAFGCKPSQDFSDMMLFDGKDSNSYLGEVQLQSRVIKEQCIWFVWASELFIGFNSLQ